MSDKFNRFRNLKNKSEEEIKILLDEAPDKCPLLGLDKCTEYYFDEGIVYVTSPAYDAYTIPEWIENSSEFIYTKIDMDDDFRREDFYIDLDSLLESGWTIDELEKLFEIRIEK